MCIIHHDPFLFRRARAKSPVVSGNPSARYGKLQSPIRFHHRFLRKSAAAAMKRRQKVSLKYA
jgi:hypothetical protein